MSEHDSEEEDDTQFTLANVGLFCFFPSCLIFYIAVFHIFFMW